MQHKQRTEKLKIVISAAARHLGIMGTLVEQISAMLEQTVGNVLSQDPPSG